MSQGASKGRKRGAKSVSATQLRAAIVPYVKLGWNAERIAPLIGKSVAQTKRYIAHPDVQARIREIDEHVMAETKARATDIASKAWEKAEELLDSEDERIVLDTVKTVLDRKGYPATTKQQSEDVTPPRTREEALARLEALVQRLRGGEG